MHLITPGYLSPLRCSSLQNIWQTRALHVGVGVGVAKVKDWSRKWLNFHAIGSFVTGFMD